MICAVKECNRFQLVCGLLFGEPFLQVLCLIHDDFIRRVEVVGEIHTVENINIFAEDEIGKIPAVKELYDLWYEKQEALSSFYKTEMPPRLPLSANPAFKTIRNAVISAADEFGVAEEETETKEEAHGMKMG